MPVSSDGGQPPDDVSSSLLDIPLHILQHELLRRQDNGSVPKPKCGTKGNTDDYNTGIHVFALFLILILSTLACAFPIVARRFPRLSIPHRFLFLSRHFGTGVLIATAFVHLLPTAFVSLTDPCLPDFWNKGYPAMPGFIAMTSVLVVVGIEMFFATRGAGHVHSSDYDKIRDEDGAKHGHGHDHGGHANGHSTRRLEHPPTHLRRFSQGALGEGGAADSIMGGSSLGNMTGGNERSEWAQVSTPAMPPGLATPLPPDVDSASPLAYSDSEHDSDLDLDVDELDPRAMDDSDQADLLHPQRGGAHSGSNNAASAAEMGHGHGHGLTNGLATTSSLSPEMLERKLLLQCLLLEAGILFHSVFIGIAVSVTTGAPFVVLLIAISFHQTFEGLALGSRIAAIPTLAPTSPKPWLMAVAYGTTTPVGQAIGLAVHGLYDPKGMGGLIMVGAMNAISSGLLLFAGLVELLAEDFLSDASYATLHGRRRIEACVAVVSGSMLMALVGAWA